MTMTDASELDNAFPEPEPDEDEGFRPFDVPDEDTGPEEKKPIPHKARKSAANLFSLLWGGIGQAMIHSGADIPVGRVLTLQAPIAGERFDAVIVDTWLDKFVQPLVTVADSAEGMGAFIALPVMVGMLERNPAAYGALEPILRQVVEAQMDELIPTLRKQKAKQRRAAANVDELIKTLDLDPETAREDPTFAIIQAIFAMPEKPPAPEGEGEPPSA